MIKTIGLAKNLSGWTWCKKHQKAGSKPAVITLFAVSLRAFGLGGGSRLHVSETALISRRS
jgi:hypothetical protein